MISNSKIFTTTVTKNNSGQTAEELAALGSQVTEQYMSQSNASNMKTQPPILPSDQRIAKDR